MKKALGIDIGGTKILYGIVNEQGEVVSEIQKTATPKTADEIYSTLEKIIDENYDNIDVVGLSSAGAVNIENTRVLSSTPNLPDGYNQIDFSTLCDKKVYVENDANCACAAEYKNGAAKGFRTVLMITIGTGIGGGVISDGKLFRGSSGNALEVGSMKIFADKRQKCTCGRYDCWESYASGTGLKNIEGDPTSSGPPSAVIHLYRLFFNSLFSPLLLQVFPSIHRDSPRQHPRMSWHSSRQSRHFQVFSPEP